MNNSTKVASTAFPLSRTRSLGSVRTFVAHVIKDYRSWGTNALPWFRGEPGNVSEPLLPKLYRPRQDGSKHNENQLVQDFRRMAPALGYGSTPDRSEIDQWLFLMQHVGVPTRLIDWTEGALIALYFALQFKKPVVWMLNSVALNRLSAPIAYDDDTYPLTWFRPE